MGFPIGAARRVFALAFSFWMMAVPLTSFARDALLCRHRAMHQDMQHGTRSTAPCWCNDMTGNGPVIVTEAASLPADLVRLPPNPATGLAIVPPPAAPLPPSPSYAPTPPPPNAISA